MIMGNELKIFEQREVLGKDFKIYGDCNNPLFLAKDVANWIEHSNSTEMLRSVDDDEKLNSTILSAGQNREVTLLTENGLYEVLMLSRKPIAKEFKTEVKKILKTIRRTGGYVANEDLFINTYLPHADENTKTLFKLNLQTITQLNNIIDKQKPLVDFAETVSSTKDIIDIGKMAKLLNDENIPIGRNKLFEWLRTNKILMKNNTPYQKYIDGGYFKIKESTKETAYGTKLFITTYVTGKGQIYIIEKLRKLYMN